MSVVVLGMEMPESCLQCILFAGNGCKGSGKIFPDWLNVAIRPTGCPLRLLPEKHGRLVDVDKLEAEGYALSKLHVDNNTGNAWREAIPFDEAQTVIEAEGD